MPSRWRSTAAEPRGTIDSTDFPTTANAFAGTYRGGFTDAFVAHLDLLPIGVRRFGVSSPGCAGPLLIGVTSMPSIGNSRFALTCHGAPPSAAGQVFLATNALTPPARVSGIDLHVDPTTVVAAVAVFSTPRGSAELPLAIPAVPALTGVRLYAQFVFSSPASPPPCPPLGLSATSGLEIVLQR